MTSPPPHAWGHETSKFLGKQRKISEISQFKEVKKRDAQMQLATELDKLLVTAPLVEKKNLGDEFDGFKKLFIKFLMKEGHSIDWEKIHPLPQDAVKTYASLKPIPEKDITTFLNKLVVVKLNGGLGTSMGCKGPKSAISVRNDLTFLDLTIQQIENLNKTYHTSVPLVLMNSFNTDEDTGKILKKYLNFNIKIYTFNQSRYPRIDKESLVPVVNSLFDSNTELWYPPGHGDFYGSFHKSGLLDKFINEGREYCFLSNIDNMGATVDFNILNLLVNPVLAPHPKYVMEVTNKTNADVKGGTLIYMNNKLRLLEIAQVPKENVEEFKSIKKFKIFNTNNLWMNLRSIKSLVENNLLDMEIIVNDKFLEDGHKVIQLETAAGAAMKDFEGAIGINVPRQRFTPVKKTSDLLLAMSNLYQIKNGALSMSPLRPFTTVPLVKLGDQHFAKVRDFLKRFSSIPDMLELDHLTVSGDVTFGKGVVLKGTVIIIANHGDRIDIPSGSILENKIVSGNLRILSH